MTLNGQRAADKAKEEKEMEMNTYVIRREKAW
jgi:hypothetical protein